MDVLRESTGSAESSLTRRQLLRAGGAGAVLLAGGGLLEACSSGSSTGAATSPATATSAPKKGGHLTVAVIGGSPSDTLDADAEVSTPDLIRVTALYNGLVTYNTGGTGVVNELAEEMTPNADATVWTIRVRSGVTFHNGKTLGAEDVAYTIRRIADPKAPLNGYSVLSLVDLNNMETLDARTLRIHMKRPLATLPEQLFPSYNYGIVPVGYDPKNPVGTGPFKFTSMTPAQQSVFVRNDNYWKPPLPYLDGITIIDSFADPQSAFNALQSGKVDVYAEADLTTARQVKSIPGLKSVISAGGQWIPFTMRVDQAPFNDVRVRQAMRLIVNRPQLVDVAFDGYADVGNDIFGQHDPAYNASLHRSQDIPQAKFLLKQAGHENLTVQLVTSDIAGGAVSCAQVLSQQARAAGVTINLNQVPSSAFFGKGYLHYTFAQDYWDYNPYLSQVAQATLPDSPFNETHFNDPAYISLYNQANATLDTAKRTDICHQMQQIDFTQGGYIIAAYNKIVDLMSTKVNGFPSGAGGGIPLGNCSWETAWLE
jgi:peptide/nickel transport system substrate-binding protein